MAKDQDKLAEAVIEGKRQRGSSDDSTAEQVELTERGRPQDTRDPRAKSSGKGKKTADKWNQ